MTINSNSEIQVMKAFRPYLRFIRTFQGENFRNKDGGTLIGNISYAALVTYSMYFTFPIMILLGVWHCVELGFDLSQIASTAPITIHTAQYLLVYISFSLKNGVINDVIYDIQRIVSRRKISRFN